MYRDQRNQDSEKAEDVKGQEERFEPWQKAADSCIDDQRNEGDSPE